MVNNPKRMHAIVLGIRLRDESIDRFVTEKTII